MLSISRPAIICCTNDCRDMVNSAEKRRGSFFFFTYAPIVCTMLPIGIVFKCALIRKDMVPNSVIISSLCAYTYTGHVLYHISPCG